MIGFSDIAIDSCDTICLFFKKILEECDLGFDQRGGMDECLGRWEDGISWQKWNGRDSCFLCLDSDLGRERVSVQKRFSRGFLVALNVGDFLMKSRWVRIPMTLVWETVWFEDVVKFKGFLYYFKKRFWTIGDIIFTKWHIPFQNQKNHLPMYHKQYTESPKISQRQLLWRLELTKVSLAVIVGDLICFIYSRTPASNSPV